MNVALCTIGRLENRYAVEYVEYYKSIGFDKIFIYDNNFGNEEHFEEVLQPYLSLKHRLVTFRHTFRQTLFPLQMVRYS